MSKDLAEIAKPGKVGTSSTSIVSLVRNENRISLGLIVITEWSEISNTVLEIDRTCSPRQAKSGQTQ